MAISYATGTLVEKVKVRGSIPDSEDYFSDDQIIERMGDILQTIVAPLIKTLQQEHMVALYDQTYTSGTTAYNLPPRAMANSLRDLSFVDSSGNEINIPILNPDLLKRGYVRSQVYGYYFQADQVVIPSTGIQYPTLRMKYYRRPNMLVPEDECAEVSSVAGSIATCVSVPSAWTTGDTFDIIKSTPAFTARGEDLAISAINGFDITFSSIPTGVVAGDWVCLAGESPIPQLPVEAFPYLMQTTVSEILENIGDPKFTTAQANAKKLEDRLVKILTPRNDGTPRVLNDVSGIFDV